MKIAPSILRTNRTIYLQKLLSKLIFLFDGYYFESWINGLSKEEGIILFWMAYLPRIWVKFLISQRKIVERGFRSLEKERFRRLSEEENGHFHYPWTKICCASPPRVADYGQFNGRKKEEERMGGEREREREGRNSRPTFASRAKNRGAESRGSPRHPLLPREFSIVPRVVPLAIFARLALSQIRFPLPVSLSLLVLIGPPPLPRRIFEPKRENARIPRETGVLIRIFPTAWNHACGLHNLFLFFFFSLSLPPRWNNSWPQRLILSRTFACIHQVFRPPMLALSRFKVGRRNVLRTVERWV